MGRWYETAYNDIGQVGASCQYADNAANAKGYEQNFRAIYSFVPYDEVDEYENTTPAVKGMYVKHKKGLKVLLTIPMTVVDFGLGPDGYYDHLIEYACVTKVGVPVIELRFSSRSSNVTPEVIEVMKKTAAA